MEIKEIFNGERKGEDMDNELKETLLKVADYHELERQKAAKIGSISFSLMFLTCAMAIVIQMVITGDLALVAGETVILLAGGLAYLYFMVKSGIWNKLQTDRTPKKDLVISVICTGIFSIVFSLMLRGKADFLYIIGAAVCFFIVFTAVSYAVLRGLRILSAKRGDE